MSKDLTGKFPKAEPTAETVDFITRQPGLLEAMANLGPEAIQGALAVAAAAAKTKNKGPKT